MTTDCYCFLYCFLYCHSVENRQVQVRACQQLCGIQLSTIGQVGQLAMTCGQAAPTLHSLPFTHIFWPPHTCCVSSVCMPSCNVSCWWSHTPDTLLKMSQKFHGCVFYHWRMSACFSHQNGSGHLDRLIFLLHQFAQGPSYALLTALCRAQLAPFTEMLVQPHTIPSFACAIVHMTRPEQNDGFTMWWHIFTRGSLMRYDKVCQGMYYNKERKCRNWTLLPSIVAAAAVARYGKSDHNNVCDWCLAWKMAEEIKIPRWCFQGGSNQSHSTSSMIFSRLQTPSFYHVCGFDFKFKTLH